MDFDQSLVVPEKSIAFSKYDYEYYNRNAAPRKDKYTLLRNAIAVRPEAVLTIVGQSYIVTKPGLYNCSEKLGYVLNGIEFLEAGKYSFRHVCTFTKPAVASYKTYPNQYIASSAGYQHVGDGYYKAYLDPKYAELEDGARRVIHNYFAGYVPVHLAKRQEIEGLAVPEYRKVMNEELDYLCGFKVREVVVGKAPEAEDDGFRLGDRYIPFIHFYDRQGYVQTISPNKDWTKIYNNQMPQLKASTGYFQSYVWGNHPAVKTFDEASNQVVMSFYDTKTEKIVFDMYLDHHMTYRIREAGRDWFKTNVKNVYLHKDGVNIWEAAFFDQLTGYEYNKKLNAYYLEKGYPSFKCPYSYHIAKDIKWIESRADNYASVQKHEMVPGYLIYFNHNDKKVVGVDGSAGGFITCADDDKMTVLETAWCQRVAVWNYGIVTDQKYMSWALTDWLVGPFAEKIGMILQEAPMIFAGKKKVSSETKAQILAKFGKGAAPAF